MMLLIAKPVLAQQVFTNLKLIKSSAVVCEFISTDRLGNLYTVSDQEISKYDANGTFLQKNSIKNLGKLYFMDASNPMKILVFYKDYNKLAFLDNMLASNGITIDLATIGYDQATLACSSHDNGFWIYDLLNFELVRFDPNLSITNKSGNIAQLTGIGINPSLLCENNNKVYLYDQESGILVFDIFGTYLKTIPIKGILDFQVENNQIYFINEKGFGSFNQQLLQEQELLLPEQEVQQIRLQKNRVYMRTKSGFAIYSYE